MKTLQMRNPANIFKEISKQVKLDTLFYQWQERSAFRGESDIVFLLAAMFLSRSKMISLPTLSAASHILSATNFGEMQDLQNPIYAGFQPFFFSISPCPDTSEFKFGWKIRLPS